MRAHKNSPPLFFFMKIYTKTGDAGETSLPGGQRVSKSCVEMEVIGELDELNAALGVVLSLRSAQDGEEIRLLSNFIQSVQRDLFKIGAEVVSLQAPLHEKIEKIGDDKILELENKIDRMWAQLPELNSFILPGGSTAGTHLHLARTVCRRAERRLVEFGKKAALRPEICKYLNRLSDYLFAAARWANRCAGEPEEKV